MGKQCISCLYGCNPYVEWIDNQRKQFDKQVKKYKTEITRGGSRSVGRKKRDARGSNDNGYEKIFYEKLKGNYSDIDKFLEKLSKEKTCKDITDGGKIDFRQVNSGKHSSGGDSGTNVESQGTFYRSDYCQPCPHCGVKKKSNGDSGNQWEEKSENDNCKNIKLYKPIDNGKGTKIEILKSGENRDDIEEKLNKFCDENKNGDNKDASLYQDWQCYQPEELEKVRKGEEDEDDHDYENDVQTGGGLCILENKNKTSDKEPHEIQKTFNNFFYYWVAHMLKDSIYWRTKRLSKCINNGKKECIKNCNGKCDCFLKWVQHKHQEWDKIKDHFKTQKNLPWDPVSILEGVLEKNLLLTSLQEAYGNEKDIKHIKELLEEDETKSKAEAAGGTDSQKKNTIDKLIDHEKKIATECKETHNDDKCKQEQENTGGARAGKPPAPTVDDDDEEEEDEDDDDGQESVEDEPHKATEQEGEDKVDGGSPQQDTEQGEGPKEGEAPSQNEVNPCEIVKTLFTTTETLKNACSTKYEKGREKFPHWKCIPSGDNTTTERSRVARQTSESGEKSGGDKDGAMCIPPRRRRLYVTPLTKLAGGDGNTQASVSQGEATQASSEAAPAPSSNPRDVVDLVKAFVESAAVETFFAWHKYKMDKEIEEKEKQDGLVTNTSEVGKKLQNDLENGDIPEEFKRQMFYTLGDYRDICVGNTPNGIDTNDKETMEKIEQKIKSVIENSGSKPSVTPVKPSDKTPQQTWWDNNAKHIWEGMICALTYKENGSTAASGGEGTQKVVKDTTVNYQTLIKKHDYNSVELKDSDETSRRKSNDDIIQTPTLKEFISRPPYFRYLEEWGENFCKERKKRLEKIKEDCEVNEDGRRGGQKKPKCSCYGEHCDDQLPENPSTFKDLWCQDCGKSCRSYRKWIERKGNEFTKQKGIYGQQKTDATSDNGNKYDSNFVEKLKQYASIDLLLQNLGACSKNNDNNKEDKLDFNNPEQTFRPATNCKPCSQFTIKCKGNAHCDNTKGEECDRKNSITAKDIQNKTDANGNIDMSVSDDSTTEFNGLEACKTSGNGKENQNKIITIRALLHRWLEYFLEDYNKIKHRISHCTKNGEGSKCENKCEEKCKKCAQEWLKLKTEEWTNIKNRLVEQYKSENDVYYNVKSSLEKFVLRTEFKNAIKPCDGLTAFEKSCGLYGTERSEKGKKDENNDHVLCMLNKLEEKAKTCLTSTSGDTQNPAQCEGSTPLPHDEEDLLLEDENTANTAPNICPTPTQPPPEPTDEDGCKPAPTRPKKPAPTTPKEPTADGGEGTEELPPPTEPPVKPAPAPDTRPVPSPVPPTPSDEPFDPTILQTTIPLGIALALGSIAFFFMKKKNTSTNSVAKNTNSDPVLNQINLFHKWLDRHRHMCENWDKNKKEELLDKLKEEWNKENINNSAKTYNSDNKSSHNHVLNTDVSIQIDMNNPKTKNEFTNMDTTPNKSTIDTILDDLEKYNEPYYYDFYKDDIYYDVNDDDKTSMDNNNNLVNKNNPVDSNSSTYNHYNPADINKTFVDINNHNQHPIEKPTKIQIEMNSNNREVVEQQYPIADIWNI
ncbi:hypothetical protein PFFCH_02718 [Plasmodium falciparum FCH/4]|uniref:Duffy-binding-like domain-containing protein n=1 Tax=Plasmodium falciparum FCH/4 TaxID=1036724 RepID=A0A024VM88_PLAFA|nr:hypothetical protein PFFCH_02718 [Plasmodium falciparum FCH/4]